MGAVLTLERITYTNTQSVMYVTTDVFVNLCMRPAAARTYHTRTSVCIPEKA